MQSTEPHVRPDMSEEHASSPCCAALSSFDILIPILCNAPASTPSPMTTSPTPNTGHIVLPPPPYFDGRQHFLDPSYRRVEQFGTRPGGPSKRRRRRRARDGDDDRMNDDEDDAEEEEDQDLLDEDDQQAQDGSLSDSSCPSDSEYEYEYTYEDLPPHLVVFDMGPESKRVMQQAGASSTTNASGNAIANATSRGNATATAAGTGTATGAWSITGLETSRPFLKVGNAVFRGEWQESLGTGILLKDDRGE